MQESASAISFDRPNGADSEEIAKLDQRFGGRVLDGPFKGMVYSESPICNPKMAETDWLL